MDCLMGPAQKKLSIFLNSLFSLCYKKALLAVVYHLEGCLSTHPNMKEHSVNSSIFFYLCFLLFFFTRLVKATDHEAHNNGIYIVYMGAAATSQNGTLRDDHNQLLSSLSQRKQDALVHTYRHGFSGFAAHLTKEEASSMAQRPGVVSVFSDPLLKLHTTRSWDFLKYQTGLKNGDSGNHSDVYSQISLDTIIGILDTGIWPESPSFTDKGMSPIPARWKGTCMEGQNFTTSNCNRKLIGARYYDNGKDHTPRDIVGHGTHVASIAAGIPTPGASYYGLATGTAKGGSRGSRIAVYRVCSPVGCLGSAILAAFDDAIADGVDVLSLSIGTRAALQPEFWYNVISIGSFHAVEKGVTVVCSAGNDGPTPETAANIAPWIMTVAATTIDRDFQSNVVLGDYTVIKGGGIQFGNLTNKPIYPLIYGLDAKSDVNRTIIRVSFDDYNARNCNPDSLDEKKVRGRIVVCENFYSRYTVEEKLNGVQILGGVGVILVDDDDGAATSTYGASPISVISTIDGPKILSYINSSRNPVATILSTESVMNYRPAPIVADFSSRGPAYKIKQILKPDIAAPGVNILAAWPRNNSLGAFGNREPPQFYLLTGTSMSCPHVSGIAAAVKSQFPTWSPSAIKSAIMTTASQTDNRKGPITTDSKSAATPYDYGAGEVTTTEPLQPGLIYETTTIDYLQFLCNYGYDMSLIKMITAVIPHGFKCPKKRSADQMSNMNYPSIAVCNFKGKKSKRVVRTVTNVGVEDETVYTATVEAPAGWEVKVIPGKLPFTKKNKKLSYEVIFTSETSPKEDVFGSVTWTNGKNKVRSPFVISS